MTEAIALFAAIVGTLSLGIQIGREMERSLTRRKNKIEVWRFGTHKPTPPNWIKD